MVQFLADEDFDNRILRAMARRIPAIDYVRVQDVGLRTKSDVTVLEWAAANDRVLLTHDRETMAGFAYDRVIAGERMAGVIVVERGAVIQEILDTIELIHGASRPEDWVDRVAFIPY